ncbi:MAG: hypothetical protein H7246_18785 [Phycisphaerae bacterium]|nr:hypothetical protein [Saprospiraceae bacterium]
MKHRRLLPFALCLLHLAFCCSLSAQTQDLAEDLPFFKTQAIEYQRWLDSTGLGLRLHVDEVKFKKNSTSEIELHLKINNNNIDSAVSQWSQLRRDFEKVEGRKLEEKLFRVFVHKMEIPPVQGNLQIYVRDHNNMYIPCFYVWIWEENDRIQIEAKLNECKAKAFDFEIKSTPIKGAKGRTADVNRSMLAPTVFDIILAYARQRYETSRCYDRYPRIEEVERTEGTLQFCVTDLCREVLTDESESVCCKTCQLLGISCNDIKRERLTFHFTYLPTASGYRLNCRLEGKFGSGFYKPRKSGYMDMEPDFEDYLDTYVKNFKNALQDRLR